MFSIDDLLCVLDSQEVSTITQNYAKALLTIILKDELAKRGYELDGDTLKEITKN